MKPLIAELQDAESRHEEMRAAFEADPREELKHRMEAAHRRLLTRQAQVAAMKAAAALPAKAPIRYEEIRSKSTRRGGHEIQGAATPGHKAEVVVGKSVRLFGSDETGARRGTPFTFDRTFVVGDIAEYASFNKSYLGRIIAIGPKTITIQEEQGDRIHRLDLHEFDWRNFDLDLEATLRRNADWSD